MKKYTKIVRLSKREDPGFANSIVRLHNRHIDAEKQDRSRFWRREAVLVQNAQNDARIVRMVMGASGTADLTLEAVALDYDGIDALGLARNVRDGEPVQITVRRASDWEVIRYYWNHPDIGYRTAHRIAAVSFAMGSIGLLLGVLPLFM